MGLWMKSTRNYSESRALPLKEIEALLNIYLLPSQGACAWHDSKLTERKHQFRLFGQTFIFLKEIEALDVRPTQT